ncbi:NADH-flavin reductase [Bacillus manliponensis]|uniref:NADH-flavin reductase n=1 Tax=Bacillus manliponensis TaxID=574376 RepID=A0A073JVI9_9BACI|nr:NAD(P)H-binding protein [Bacillus manliponensis]KEK18226.1 NADH-flavin reductase [Bacillus manliponensis]
MKVAIIGGNGKVGRFLMKTAVEAGYKVQMLMRDPNLSTNLSGNVKIIQGDATNIEDIRSVLTGCDAVINTIGPAGKGVFIFHQVTSHIITVMKELHINRYILVSGGSLDVEGDRKSFINKLGAKMFRVFLPAMMEDKQKELACVEKSNIEWTLVRLPFVVDDISSNEIKESLINMPGVKIHNGDIARFLIEQISDNTYIRKCPFIAN